MNLIPLKRGVLNNATLYDKICRWLATSSWFSPGTLVSSTNKNDHHDVTEPLLKVALKPYTNHPFMKLPNVFNIFCFAWSIMLELKLFSILGVYSKEFDFNVVSITTQHCVFTTVCRRRINCQLTIPNPMENS